MIRRLTSGERALAMEVFGDRLPLDAVRIVAAPWPFVRAFVPGRWFRRDWIVWPARALPPDVSTAPVALQATLIHELVHVWQVRQGVFLPWAKLIAGDGPGAYRYPYDDCVWARLNIEQQAMLVEHQFRLSRGLSAPMPADFYRRVIQL